MKRLATMVCLLVWVATTVSAAEFDADREIRIAERMQEETALMTQENAEQLLALLQGYRFNRLADEKTLDAIATIHGRLNALAIPVAEAGITNMLRVSRLLLQARAVEGGGGKRDVLLSASRTQAGITKILERLVAIARARLGGLSASKTMKALIEEQEKLRNETGELATETVGLTADDLDEDLRADLGTMGDAQGRLRRDLNDTLSGLIGHAAEVAPFQSDYAELIRRAVAAVTDQNVSGLMAGAARHVVGNQLLQAGRAQDQVLASLAKALAILNEELPVLVIEDTGGVPADIGSGPAAGSIDGAFPDLPPFEVATDQQDQEYVPGIGLVPLVKGSTLNGAATWLVGLPEKERQMLTSAAEERFPAKYDALLKAYYRALAGGQEEE